MEFNEYAELALKTMHQKATETDKEIIARVALGVGGEAGEVCEKVKKYLRGDKTFAETRELIAKEIGDVLWYLSVLSSDKYGFNLDFNEIAVGNIKKLSKRKEKGTLMGDGDNR